MKSLFTDICIKMGHSEELSDLKGGTFAIGQITLLLEILQSAVSGIIGKWKSLEAPSSLPGSRRPCRVTEWGQRLIRSMVCKSHQVP